MINIKSHADNASFSGTELTVDYEWRSPSGLAVERVDILLDGRPLKAVALPVGTPRSVGVNTGKLTVSLPQRNVELALIARAGELASEPARVKLVWGGPAIAPREVPKPKLYALVIGVSNYSSPQLKLGYAAKDARDIDRLLRAQQGGLYSEVHTRLLVDREVTRAEVIKGLQWLETQMTRREDIGVVFFAGHGITDEKQTYWFLPHDSTPEEVRTNAISKDDVLRTLRSLAGKAVWILDTCHAGGAVADARRVDINVIINEIALSENGIVGFASSQGRETSVERDEWKNGAFTKALIEAVEEGKANLYGDGVITLALLDSFVVRRVKQLTNEQQRPVMSRPAMIGGDFPIALFRSR